ncbi:MAG: fused MFS/spermidine synthase [Bacteroidales bacterium]|jgi:spermidine synthase
MDYLLSYLYPITVEVTSSLCNPVLEIVLNGGKYSLNSENTNYSYGSLHALFQRIFRKLKLDWTEINNVLILGFGTGSVAEIIGRYKPDCIIDGVEIDNKVIELGEKYFKTDLFKNVTIHCASADLFVKDCLKKFDLVVIDVYKDLKVPEELETDQFLVSIRNLLRSGGTVIFNKFIYDKISRNQLPSLKESYEKIFRDLKIMTVMITGKIFIAKN